MADNNTAGTTNNNSPLPLGEGPGVRATGTWTRPNPYVQVALTYLRRPFSSSVGSIVAVGAILIPVSCSLSAGQSGDRDLRFLLLAFLFLSIFLAIHMVQQFADSHTHLTPDFRRVHIVVAAAMAIAVTVLAPALITSMMGLRSVGLVAIATLVFGTFFFSLLYPSASVAWLMPVGMIAIWTPWGEIFLQEFVSGQCELQALGLFMLGGALSLLGGIRMFRMTEDTPEYRALSALGANRMTGPRPGEGGMPSGGARGWLAERLGERMMAVATRHARVASSSPWSRVCRWQTGMATGWSGCLLVIVLCLLGFVLIGIMGQDLRSAGVMFPLIIFSSFLPQGIVWGAFWRRRARMVAYELLLPVDRRGYVRQLGLAVAIGQLQLWSVFSIAIALWSLTTAQQLLPLANVARLLVVLALLQPWFFGFGTWFTRYRSFAMLLAADLVAFYVALIPLLLSAAPPPLRQWSGLSVPLAGMIAMLGLLMTSGAYRRWLVTDFD